MTDLAHHGDAEIGPGLIDFAVNVRGATPPRWLADLVRASVADLAAYPDATRARAAVARRHDRDTAEVLLTSGAAEAFVLLARVLRPAHALVVHPQFTEPEAALRAAGHRVDRLLLDGDFVLDPSRVPESADLVMIGNPTNPTSVLHPAPVLASLARPGRTIVVDEAFMDCVPGEPESLAGDRGVVILRSLTKTWGLAGLRAGYVLAPEPLIGELAAAQPLWAVSTPALVAIEACSTESAVREADDWAAGMGVLRDRLAAELGALGLHVVPGARASFLLVRAGAGVREALRDRGIAVRRGDTFPGLGAEWVRIAVRDAGSCQKLVRHLREVGKSSESVTISTTGARTVRPEGTAEYL
ncbi:MAG: Rv2231c family pyridoxal phosphate-dependent protein CobC [Streptosporangiaceae bacterium]